MAVLFPRGCDLLRIYNDDRPAVVRKHMRSTKVHRDLVQGAYSPDGTGFICFFLEERPQRPRCWSTGAGGEGVDGKGIVRIHSQLD